MSETDPMTLADWLLEQIAEDEAVARAATGGPWNWTGEVDCSLYAGDDPGDGIAHASWETDDHSPGDFAHIARHDPARVLAECAAKRAVVDDLSRFIANADAAGARKDHPTLLAGLERQLLYLAQPYADRPGWRKEWAL